MNPFSFRPKNDIEIETTPALNRMPKPHIISMGSNIDKFQDHINPYPRKRKKIDTKQLTLA